MAPTVTMIGLTSTSIHTLTEHRRTLTFATVSKVADSVSLLISMKEILFSFVQKSGKCVTKITLD